MYRPSFKHTDFLRQLSYPGLFIFIVYFSLNCSRAELKKNKAEQPALQNPAGEFVTVYAEKSFIMSQHPIEQPDFRVKYFVSYYMWGGIEKVVYSKTKIDCPKKVLLSGYYKTVTASKYGMTGTETQFIADSWRCRD